MLKIFTAALFIALLFSSCVNSLPPRNPATAAPPPIQMPVGTPLPQGKGNEVDMARITEQNVVDLTLALSRPDSYIWHYSVKRSFADFEKITENTVYVSRGRLYYECEENGSVVSSVYVFDGKVYVIDLAAKKFNSFFEGGDIDPLFAVSSVGDVLSLSEINIDSGSETVIGSEVCLLLKVTEATLDLDETYTISLRTGLPVAIVSDIGGYVYELETHAVDVGAQIDEDIFILPAFVT